MSRFLSALAGFALGTLVTALSFFSYLIQFDDEINKFRAVFLHLAFGCETISSNPSRFQIGIALLIGVVIWYRMRNADKMTDMRRESSVLDKRASMKFSAMSSRRLLSLEHPSLGNDHVNFLTDVVKQLWVHLSPAIGETIKQCVEPIFKTSLPGPLSTLHFTKCDFGRVPITFDNIIVHPIKDGAVKIDLDVVWDGACEISLEAKRIKVGVQNLKLFGRMQLLMKPLTDVLPCISAIQYSFINVPKLELDFTGIGNLVEFGGIDKTIVGLVQNVLANLMVLPHRLMFKMDVATNFKEISTPPEGIARITAVSGRGFVVEEGVFSRDIPDVYLKIKVGNSREWKTSVQNDNLTPAWDESGDFLLNDVAQNVIIEAWDEDLGTFDADDFLGRAEVSVSDILLGRGKTLEVELLNDDNTSLDAYVTLHCHVADLLAKTESIDLTPRPNCLGGAITIVIVKAINLPLSRKLAESFVKVTCGSEEFFTGMVVHLPDYPEIDCLNPVYDISFQIPISHDFVKNGLQDVVFDLMNGYQKPSSLGTLRITPKELMETKGHKIVDLRKIGKGGALLEFQVSLLGVEKFQPRASSSKSAALKDDEEVNHVKITIISGKGFRIRKRRFSIRKDIPDVYCNVKFGSSPAVWRTKTIDDCATPVWNESQSYILTSQNQIISLEAWDSNSKSSDTFLGTFRISVGKILLDSGEMEVELQNQGKMLGHYITLSCELE